jgi:hypothetical protein
LLATICGGIFVLLFIFPARPLRAQKEVTAPVYRYRQKEVITRHFEAHEVMPRPRMPVDEGPILRKGIITISPTAHKIRHRATMADSHLGLRFYQYRACTDCHPRQARNLHQMRAKISCRQCHGPEPIAGIKHYYSPMHKRLRHAYICAKCHKGASSAFAKYIIHEPKPAYLTTRDTFPLLFYVFWLMVALAAGTFAAFLPYTVMLGVREFLPHHFQLSIKGKKLLVRWRKSDDTG